LVLIFSNLKLISISESSGKQLSVGLAVDETLEKCKIFLAVRRICENETFCKYVAKFKKLPSI